VFVLMTIKVVEPDSFVELCINLLDITLGFYDSTKSFNFMSNF